MPYIQKERRQRFEKAESLGLLAYTPGELNYVVTKICLGYLKKYGLLTYERLNSVMGILDCVKQELYRRLIVDYEEAKRKENGDVYV